MDHPALARATRIRNWITGISLALAVVFALLYFFRPGKHADAPARAPAEDSGDVSRLKSHVAQLLEQREQAYKENDDLRRQIGNLGSQSGELSQLRQELSRAKTQAETERRAAEQYRRQSEQLNAQIGPLQKKVAELTERQKVFQNSELALKAWMVRPAEGPSGDGAVLTPFLPDDEKHPSPWKWTESTAQEIPLSRPSYAATILYATASVTGKLELRVTEAPLLWLNRDRVTTHSSSSLGNATKDSKSEQILRYTLSFEPGYNLLMLSVPLDPLRPYFSAVLMDDHGGRLHSVQPLSARTEVADYLRRPRPSVEQILKSAEPSPDDPAASAFAEKLRSRANASDLESRSADRKERMKKGMLAYPVPSNLLRSGNLVWVPLWEDRFDRAEVGSSWAPRSGTWMIHEGALCGKASEEGNISAVLPASGDVRLEYDAVLLEGNCDLSCYFLGSEERTYQDGYFVGFGSNGNLHSKVRRQDVDVLFTTDARISRGRKHHVVAERIGNVVRMFVDGTQALYYEDPQPLTSGKTWGLYTWDSHVHFDNVRLWSAVYHVSAESELLRLLLQKAEKGGAPEREAVNTLWTPMAEDTFDDGTIGRNWVPALGTWTVDQGALCSSENADHTFVQFHQPLTGNVRIEYEGTVAGGSRQSDLSVFIHGTEREHLFGGYFLGFGSNKNTKSKILRQGEEVTSNLLAHHTPGRRHRMAAEYVEGVVRMWADDELILQTRDPSPLEGPGHGTLGLYTFGSHAHFDRIRVYAMPPLQADTLAEVFLRRSGKKSSAPGAADWVGKLVAGGLDGKEEERVWASVMMEGVAAFPYLQAMRAVDDRDVSALGREWMRRIMAKPGGFSEWEALWEQYRKSSAE